MFVFRQKYQIVRIAYWVSCLRFRVKFTFANCLLELILLLLLSLTLSPLGFCVYTIL